MPSLNIQNNLNVNDESASIAGQSSVGVQSFLLYSAGDNAILDGGFAVNALSTEEEASSITGHANSSGLVPDRIDLSGIDLDGTGGVVPQVVIDNIYNANKIAQWEYAYNKSVKTVTLTNVGRNYTIRITFLDDTYVEDTVEINTSVMDLLGQWNAATNVPTLQNGVGNVGDIYKCNYAGTANFGGVDIVFNAGDLVMYDGAVWDKVSSGIGTGIFARNVYSFNATAGQIVYTFPYIPNQVDVFYNGSRLPASDFIATNGSNVTLLFSPIVGDLLTFNAYVSVAGEIAGGGTAGSLAKWNATSQLTDAVPGTDYQEPITLTTNGNGGNATFVDNVLNVPREHYVHDQQTASASWTVTHNMNKFPAVSIVDTANDEVIGQVTYNTLNQLTITFTAAFSGKAYLN
jgi:hypothetical protein